jgi:hypothetical protein
MAPSHQELALIHLEQTGARSETISVVREETAHNHDVVAATFQTQEDRQRHGFVVLRRLGIGWKTVGGWSAAPLKTSDDLWLCSGGYGRGDLHVYGGWVSEPLARSIRVTDSRGRVEEDAIVEGVAILVWEGEVALRTAAAELLDADGRVIRAGALWPDRS